ncbi:MAG TPA: uracil-DNA glycosylase [Solirubrobacterales bacterium]|nr:uracil-DNA glycosylase [Solirubrobacterales bacterium]
MGAGKSRWIAKFVDELASVPSEASFSNFYSTSVEANAVRRHNLACYLHDLQKRSPNVLMVGECPGYRGTKVTGVPFADVPVVVDGVDRLEMFGIQNGYLPPAEEHYPPKEQTSTAMWQVLAHHQFVPLLWASFPFHAYGDSPDTNRTPTKDELLLGREFLLKILSDWQIDTVVAVGRVAERTLGTLQVPCRHIRHPARGGKQDFQSGVARLLTDESGHDSSEL